MKTVEVYRDPIKAVEMSPDLASFIFQVITQNADPDRMVTFKIGAIKAVRALAGIDLRQAKYVVDDILACHFHRVDGKILVDLR